MRFATLIVLGSIAVAPCILFAQPCVPAIALDSSGDLYNYDCSFLTGGDVNRVYVKLRATDDRDAIEQIKAMHSDAHAILVTRLCKVK
jgi:hypothetical protein